MLLSPCALFCGSVVFVVCVVLCLRVCGLFRFCCFVRALVCFFVVISVFLSCCLVCFCVFCLLCVFCFCSFCCVCVYVCFRVCLFVVFAWFALCVFVIV